MSVSKVEYDIDQWAWVVSANMGVAFFKITGINIRKNTINYRVEKNTKKGLFSEETPFVYATLQDCLKDISKRETSYIDADLPSSVDDFRNENAWHCLRLLNGPTSNQESLMKIGSEVAKFFHEKHVPAGNMDELSKAILDFMFSLRSKYGDDFKELSKEKI